MTNEKIPSFENKETLLTGQSNDKIIKHTVKDSVFTHLFRQKEYLFLLFKELHPEITDVSEEDLKIQEIQNVVLNGVFNDLSFLAKDRLMILMEAQSTWCPNMPARMVVYYGRLLERYINQHHLNLFSTAPQDLPAGEFYMVYSGSAHEEITELNLEDLCQHKSQTRLQVKVIRKTGSNSVLDQYLSFTDILRKQESIYGKRNLQALQTTIKICINEGILADFLSQTKEEIEDFMLEIFNQEHAVENMMIDVEKNSEARGEIKSLINFISNMIDEGFGWETIRKCAKVPETLLPEILKIFPEYRKA